MSLLALLVPSAVASANATQFTLLEAPNELLSGAPDATLDEIKSLGADGIRLQLYWRALAPDPEARKKPSFNASDPEAYSNWGRWDAAIDGARARGLKVHVTIAGSAPTWATANKDPNGIFRPDASEFAKFASAVGKRYRSKVALWSIWNEPNLGKYLQPIARGESATIYRNLYVKAYSALRGAGVTAPIVLGELAPQGNRLKTIGTVAPLTFLRGMLCLDARYKKTRSCAAVPAQGVAIHPYSTAPGPFLRPLTDLNNVTIGVLDRLTSALDKAAKAGTIAKRMPIYVTEFGVQSFPDRRTGVPLDVQSDYRGISERISYLNPRVKSFSQYLLTDDADSAAGNYGSFQSGLYLADHRPKPALFGFRLPLVVVPSRSATRATLWGLVRPATGAGRVTVEYSDNGRSWKTLGSQRYASNGYFTRPVSTTAKRRWRIVWDAPDGTTYTGSATRAWTKPWSG
ncbi:cellulase family glycosylhydrolase [Conexibacter sp. JD483]|uniref:cellulase family glycosylhydrolase n=1 Tax=unclassified Conexibacter TaxID=2627773 RepID=UPI002721CB5A|nr:MULTISPECIES: cellulase family glycosylhydrolase [unclassified Conexibacter]MDO8185393.1 cellulase family glycosylhydrolase [Conexibacter sp. CPCC 205706]MDO8198431.1 cellulase family glycosylhydrolase [Conexibacter sp. CPCC 205762]MDR9371639.1 cellulase family glycosylhydrolase [Conexibacter sp. JD483]